MIALYDAVKFTTMLFFIQKILRFNLGVAFLKSVSILGITSTESLTSLSIGIASISITNSEYIDQHCFLFNCGLSTLSISVLILSPPLCTLTSELSLYPPIFIPKRCFYFHCGV